MGRDDYKTCRICGCHADDVGPMSHTRLCGNCWQSRFIGNLDAMRTMSGPFARHWRQRMAASVGASLLDELDTKA